jgi:hypothetical protein
MSIVHHVVWPAIDLSERSRRLLRRRLEDPGNTVSFDIAGGNRQNNCSSTARSLAGRGLEVVA